MKRWGMAMNGWGRAGELSFSCFTVSKEVPWQALGSLMYSRESEHRAHPRWDLVDLLGGGQWSQLWGVVQLQWVMGLSGTPGGIAESPLSWFTSCRKGSSMPGLFSSCYSSFVTCLCATNLGLPWGPLWHLLGPLHGKYQKPCPYQGTPSSVCFCGCWNS